MDHGPFDSHNNEIGDKPAPAAAIAAAHLQHAEEVKNTAEPSSAAAPLSSADALNRLVCLAWSLDRESVPGLPPRLPPEIGLEWHEPLATIMIGATRQLVQTKNVTVMPPSIVPLAYLAMERLDAGTLHGMLNGDTAAMARAGRSIDNVLDVIAASQFILSLWQVEGFTEMLPTSFTPHAEAWVKDAIANDIPNRRLRWPGIIDMLVSYYRWRRPQRAVVMHPENQPSRISVFLDCAAIRKPMNSDAGNQQFLMPLLMRCPCLPGKFIPDGKQTTTLPDGSVRTVWWQTQKPHRDVQLGPAIFVRAPDGTVTEQSYWRNGEHVESQPRGAS